MPVYEYRCGNGHQYEKTEGFDAPARQSCPTCGSKAKRMISLPAVIFKGSGFYHTDNRKESSGGNGRSSEVSESNSASTGDRGHSDGDGAGHSHVDNSKSSAKVEAAAAD